MDQQPVRRNGCLGGCVALMAAAVILGGIAAAIGSLTELGWGVIPLVGFALLIVSPWVFPKRTS